MDISFTREGLVVELAFHVESLLFYSFLVWFGCETSHSNQFLEPTSTKQ